MANAWRMRILVWAVSAAALPIFLHAGTGWAQTPESALHLTVQETPIGRVYADRKGMTLYTFNRDSPGRSNCVSNCLRTWSPVLATPDAKSTRPLTIITRDDGTKQWAYNDLPLYRFPRDAKPGDVNGENMGTIWHALPAAVDPPLAP